MPDNIWFVAAIWMAMAFVAILVSVVILSAFVPMLLAERFFKPTIKTMHAWGRLYRMKGNQGRSLHPMEI